MHINFLIIGGGIAGLSTALALRKIGIEATITESATEYQQVGAGITLASNALAVFKQLGIYDEIIEAGILLKKASIIESSGKLISKVDLSNLGNEYSNLGIHRAELSRVLLNHMEPEKVLWNKRAVSVEHHQSFERVYFDDESHIDCDYLIVADGIHSAIRNQLIPNSKIRYAGYTCWRGISTNKLISRGKAIEVWGDKGRFGYVPINADLVYWFATRKTSRQNKKMKEMSSEQLAESFDLYPEEIRNLILQTNDKRMLWNDIIDLEPIKKYAFGRIVLIGDAAHATTPNLGQGACQAIEDAWFLSQNLRTTQSPIEAFIAYEAKRLKRTNMIVSRSLSMGKIAEWRNPIAIQIRNALFRNIPLRSTLTQMKKILDIDSILKNQN